MNENKEWTEITAKKILHWDIERNILPTFNIKIMIISSYFSFLFCLKKLHRSVQNLLPDFQDIQLFAIA